MPKQQVEPWVNWCDRYVVGDSYLDRLLIYCAQKEQLVFEVVPNLVQPRVGFSSTHYHEEEPKQSWSYTRTRPLIDWEKVPVLGRYYDKKNFLKKREQSINVRRSV